MASLKNIAAAVIGLAIFAFILSKVDVAKVTGIIASLDIGLYIAALLMLCAVVVLKGLKWKLILQSQQINISLADACKYFLAGFFFSSFTPGRLGDLLRAFYVRKERGLGFAIGSVVLDRVSDVGILLVFAIIATGYLAYVMGIVVIPLEAIALLLGLVILATYLLFREKYVRAILRPVYSVFIPEKFRKKMSVGFEDFFRGTSAVRSNKNPFLLAIGSGFLQWILSLFFAYVLAFSINVQIPMWLMFVLYPVVILSDLVPFTVSGLGAREGIMIFFFSLAQLPSEQAVAFSLLMFVTVYVLVALAGYIVFAKEPVEIRKAAQSF